MKTESRYGQFDPHDRAYPELADIYEYWLRKLEGRLAPSWADVELVDLPAKAIPRVCVVDVSADRTGFIYRFWGTAITGMHHYDLTGKSVLNLKPAHYAKTIYKQYELVYETKEPQGFLTEVPLASGLLAYYAVVRLPLSSNGQDIDMILSAEDHGREREQLRDSFEKVIRDRA